MDEQQLLSLLRQVKEGTLDESDFVRRMKALPYRDLGEVKFDTHRQLRKGFAEIVYCPGKSDSQIESIANAFADTRTNILFSRATTHQFGLVQAAIPDAAFHEKARIIAGEFDVFEGPINDNTGVERVAAGASMTDEEKLAFDWLVDGVIGEIPQ